MSSAPHTTHCLRATNLAARTGADSSKVSVTGWAQALVAHHTQQTLAWELCDLKGLDHGLQRTRQRSAHAVKGELRQGLQLQARAWSLVL